MGKWYGGNDIDPNDEHRDWRMIDKIIGETFTEQKRARRWGVFFKAATLAYLVVILILAYSAGPGGADRSEDHTALIRIEGPIAADTEANANAVAGALRDAFDTEAVQGIILAINTPGGSPVQSGYIYDEIKRLRQQHPHTKVYAVISDLGASGGYYVAAAADEIYADKASLVGSIGVTASSFGFVETIEKLGIERRHFTAGEHKAFLDPFSDLKESEKVFWQAVLNSTHQQFIKAVKDGRGERLKENDQLFSGLIWNGEQALELGLIDGLGSAGHVAREVIGTEDIILYGGHKPLLKRLTEQLGASIGNSFGQGAAKALGLEQSYPVQF
ncbi:signal peptide peptidase SppA [Pseudomaricurvus alkylphenolicus]|jgi:protease-4|uniref:signal peptide peptidase SppA n=1 Tax=Pseudomaricurvus alkylphenolicus TaxID=1306991 RepID=UPI00141DB88D|nr:signal peptide peptidase SppA [Pseudomaricurvus alkylphenolicus]NIB41394.1 signal peptide peptidase SppA [Pseudomaricurvus alkylphenolicus]